MTAATTCAYYACVTAYIKLHYVLKFHLEITKAKVISSFRSNHVHINTSTNTTTDELTRYHCFFPEGCLPRRRQRNMDAV